MTELRIERSDWASYNQLLHELIGGSVRRHTFTGWELTLLLDLQNATIRKSSRPETLRKYLRAVNKAVAQGASSPPRFSLFFEAQQAKRRPAPAEPPEDILLPRAS